MKDNCASSQIGDIRMKDTLKMQVEELKVQFNCNIPAEGTWGSYYCWTEMLRPLQQFWMVFDVEHWDFIKKILRASNGTSHKHKESKLNQLLRLEFYRVLLRWKVHRSLMALVLLATINVIVHLFVTSFFLSSFQLSPQQERKRALTVWSKVCFAIGGAPYQITATALGFFLQIFLLDVALVSIHMGTL